MPRVKVKYFGRLRSLLGIKYEFYEVSKGTMLKDLLLFEIPQRHRNVSEIWRQEMFRIVKGEILFNEDGTPVLDSYIVLTRGRTPSLRSRLKEEDELMILPPLYGG